MYKLNSPYTLQHVMMKNYDGFFLGFHLKPLGVERTKEHLPTWLPYLGYALLTAALVAGAIAIGCICVKCCRPFCVVKETMTMMMKIGVKTQGDSRGIQFFQ